MGLVHTPRVLLTLAKSMRQPSNKLIGITEPHIYHGRAGLFDVDYLGHLNNAAYLNHAEYARWSMSAVNGWLQAGLQHGSQFVLTSASCRYRAEIRPIFRKFQIETIVTGMDDKHMWIYHSFRHAAEGDDRVRAQILVKGMIIENRKSIDPREYLEKKVGVTDLSVLESMHRPNSDAPLEEMMVAFEALDGAQRKHAALQDTKVIS